MKPCRYESKRYERLVWMTREIREDGLKVFFCEGVQLLRVERCSLLLRGLASMPQCLTAGWIASVTKGRPGYLKIHRWALQGDHGGSWAADGRDLACELAGNENSCRRLGLSTLEARQLQIAAAYCTLNTRRPQTVAFSNNLVIQRAGRLPCAYIGAGEFITPGCGGCDDVLRGVAPGNGSLRLNRSHRIR
jgi:hypothetical protein